MSGLPYLQKGWWKVFWNSYFSYLQNPKLIMPQIVFIVTNFRLVSPPCTMWCCQDEALSPRSRLPRSQRGRCSVRRRRRLPGRRPMGTLGRLQRLFCHVRTWNEGEEKLISIKTENGTYLAMANGRHQLSFRGMSKWLTDSRFGQGGATALHRHWAENSARGPPPNGGPARVTGARSTAPGPSGASTASAPRTVRQALK